VQRGGCQRLLAGSEAGSRAVPTGHHADRVGCWRASVGSPAVIRPSSPAGVDGKTLHRPQQAPTLAATAGRSIEAGLFLLRTIRVSWVLPDQSRLCETGLTLASGRAVSALAPSRREKKPRGVCRSRQSKPAAPHPPRTEHGSTGSWSVPRSGGCGSVWARQKARAHCPGTQQPSSPMARGSVQPCALRAVPPALDDACDSASIRTVQMQATEYVPVRRTDPRSRVRNVNVNVNVNVHAGDGVSPTPRGIHICWRPAPTSSSTWPSCRCSLTCQLLWLQLCRRQHP
jgi:hypothetical protein